LNSFYFPTPEEQLSFNQQYNLLQKKQSLLPIKVTPFFEKKVLDEVLALGHTLGPLHRMVYPTEERLNIHLGDEVYDFIGDREHKIAGTSNSIIRKYRNRILFIPTHTCASHCQYCFRQDLLEKQRVNNKKNLNQQLDGLENYLNEHPEIEEVILSGGDPMTLSLSALEKIIKRLKTSTHIESIRLHTKALSYSPNLFSDEKLELLADACVRLVFHLSHPYEICHEVEEVIGLIQSYGIRCYNQFPLIRNINDHVKVLEEHLKLLDNLRIRNLSIFLIEPTIYSASFRISLKRWFRIIDEFNWNSASWINSTRFVLDSPIGKIRKSNMIEFDENKKIAIFQRQGKKISYHDFPEELDIPGKLTTMLWR
jgi:KamA family protein